MGGAAWARIAIAGALGLVTSASLFVALVRPPGEPGYLAFVFVAVLQLPFVVGSFVFTIVAKPRPAWWYGAVFGVVATAIEAALLPVAGWLVVLPLIDMDLRLALVFWIIQWLIASMVGGMLAWLVSRILRRPRPDGVGRRLKPWHVGLAVAAGAVVLAGVMIALALAGGVGVGA